MPFQRQWAATLSTRFGEPTLRDATWLANQWERARLLAARPRSQDVVLAIDEVQKTPGWSETVKRLWDEDPRARRALRVVLLCSAPLLVQRGLTESLAGRFEVLHLPHWSFSEMERAFGFTLEQYLFFGGYPGAAPLISDPPRWRRYVLDSLVETTISRDVLLMTRVDGIPLREPLGTPVEHWLESRPSATALVTACSMVRACSARGLQLN